MVLLSIYTLSLKQYNGMHNEKSELWFYIKFVLKIYDKLLLSNKKYHNLSTYKYYTNAICNIFQYTWLGSASYITEHKWTYTDSGSKAKMLFEIFIGIRPLQTK